MPPHPIGKETETQRDSVICPISHSQYIGCFRVQVRWTTHSPVLDQGGSRRLSESLLKILGWHSPQISSSQQLHQRILLWKGGLWRKEVAAPTEERMRYLNLNVNCGLGGWRPRQGHSYACFGQRAWSSIRAESTFQPPSVRLRRATSPSHLTVLSSAIK